MDATIAGARDSKEALSALENGSSPPPYEATAYPKVRHTPRIRKLSSARLRVAALFLALSLSWICLWKGHFSHGPNVTLSALEEEKFQSGLSSCAAIHKRPARTEAQDRRENPRWNPTSGQNHTVILRNATLFDGESFLDEAVDIVFTKGLIVSVAPTTADEPTHEHLPADAEVINLSGAYVTPGLVDMHSHHLVIPWPHLASTEDADEENSGPLTPFIRAIDGMKPYDPATRLIASGGVTSSLIIPGSANIIGGEGAAVKNARRPGEDGELVVEEMLLEHGVGAGERRRYMKLACGENPKVTYGHTRLGSAWALRRWLARAGELVGRQEGWCEAARGAAAAGDGARARLLAQEGGFPEDLELESTAGVLRGRVAVHNHCYEPEDFETMIRISREFGFRVRAFHHALSAWQVPELLKEYDGNLTIATFAEFAFYKSEAYAASLSAGKILSDHGLPVAYKSDHSVEDINAKYLLLQSAVGHSFGLPEDKALQAVTSVPAAAIELDNRIGYVRPGYDADVVVWDSHPLSVGATPRQVLIDGVATLDPVKVEESTAKAVAQGGDAYRGAGKPAMRAVVAEEERARFCSASERPGQSFVITGVRKSFLEESPSLTSAAEGAKVQTGGGNLTVVIDDGEITCIGDGLTCEYAASRLHERRSNSQGVVSVDLRNGHLSRGLTAVTSSLGIAEISMDPGTGDGIVDKTSPEDAAGPYGIIAHAKYGVSLGGKNFARARLGGVTRAVQAPLSGGGLIVGVSTGLRTGVAGTLLDGGLFQDDVALHVALGDDAKADEGAISKAIGRLRGLVKGGERRIRGTVDEEDIKNDPWALVANGSLPLVVKADSTHDIQQVILLKRDYPAVKAVIFGGHEAPLLADDIAKAKIPLIFTGARPGPETWTKKDSPPGPPLSRSPADTLNEAGVLYALSLNTGGGPPGDPRLQSLALEASWAAKYAGLSEHEALGLVSTNVEEILGLERSGDVVVWEGNPLQFGTPVLAFQEREGRAGNGIPLQSNLHKCFDARIISIHPETHRIRAFLLVHDVLTDFHGQKAIVPDRVDKKALQYHWDICCLEKTPEPSNGFPITSVSDNVPNLPPPIPDRNILQGDLPRGPSQAASDIQAASDTQAASGASRHTQALDHDPLPPSPPPSEPASEGHGIIRGPSGKQGWVLDHVKESGGSDEEESISTRPGERRTVWRFVDEVIKDPDTARRMTNDGWRLGPINNDEEYGRSRPREKRQRVASEEDAEDHGTKRQRLESPLDSTLDKSGQPS